MLPVVVGRGERCWEKSDRRRTVQAWPWRGSSTFHWTGRGGHLQIQPGVVEPGWRADRQGSRWGHKSPKDQRLSTANHISAKKKKNERVIRNKNTSRRYGGREETSTESACGLWRFGTETLKLEMRTLSVHTGRQIYGVPEELHGSWSSSSNKERVWSRRQW